MIMYFTALPSHTGALGGRPASGRSRRPGSGHPNQDSPHRSSCWAPTPAQTLARRVTTRAAQLRAAADVGDLAMVPPSRPGQRQPFSL